MQTTFKISGILGWQLSPYTLGYANQTAVAQSWPSRPVTMVVPFAAGTTSDILARSLAQYLSETLGQSFVVDNRAGGGGNIGAAAVARAPQDGYTLLFATTGTGRNQQADVPQHAIRSGKRLRADRTCRQVAGTDHGACGCAVFNTQGVHRLRTGESGQDQRRLPGQRNARAHHEHTSAKHGRRQIRHRSVPRRRRSSSPI